MLVRQKPDLRPGWRAVGAGLPSHVLAAMGVPPEEAASCLRFSLSELTTEAEIGYCIEQIPPIVARMRRVARQPVKP
jgi:cysteine desulfurase